MRTNYIEIFVGTLVVILAGFFLSYAYQANKSNMPYAFHLKAKFERVDGVLEGSDIRLRGVKVGEVTALNLTGEDMMAELTLSFYKKYNFAVDSVIEVASEGLMGPKYVAIIPGESDSYAKEGHTMAYTQPSISLESLIAKFVFSGNTKDEEKKDK